MTKQPTPLPCPFCGVAPFVGPSDDTQGNAFGYVECVNKFCAARPHVEDGEQVSDERGRIAYQRAAIRRWNKRAKVAA